MFEWGIKLMGWGIKLTGAGALSSYILSNDRGIKHIGAWKQENKKKTPGH